jgi:CheY-like chemotaxis protein
MPPDTSNGKSHPPRILIVDDDAGQRSLLDYFLKSQGFDTVPVSSGERALEVLPAGGFNMMISDVRMPGLSGLETLRRARQQHAVLPVLLVTAYADIREAVGAMRDGAVNYLAKPIDLDELLASVRQATGISKAAPLKFSEEKQLPAYVVAKSPLMQALFHDASLIAPSESRVLITGESGVGKDVIARVVHVSSPRAAQRYVALNCASVVATLLPSIRDVFGPAQAGRSGGGVREIAIAVLRAEKAGPARDVRITHHDIGWHPLIARAQLVRHDGAQRWVDDRAARRPAGMQQIRRRRMVGRHRVVDRAQQHTAIQPRRHASQMLAHPHARDRGRDGVVVRAGNALAVAALLRIPGIDLAGAATEPNEDASLRSAAGQGKGGGMRTRHAQRIAGQHGRAGQAGVAEKLSTGR